MPSSDNLSPERSSSVAKPAYVYIFFALCTLTALMVTYFIYFQPRILRAYTDNIFTKAGEMVLDVSQKYGQLQTTTADLLAVDTPTGSAAECSNELAYQNVPQKKAELAELQESLVPDETLSFNPTVSRFWEQQIFEVHQVNYRDYNAMVMAANEESANVFRVLDFMEVKNTWMDACVDIQVSLSAQEVIDQCRRALLISTRFSGAKEDSIAASLVDIERHCALTQEADFVYTNSWNFEFLKMYNQLLAYDVSGEVLDQGQILEDRLQKFSQNIASRNELISQYANEKSIIAQSWYLLELNL